jgi:hypothetical protein
MKDMLMTRISGLLTTFCETGTEGVIWSLQCPYLPGYDGLLCLQKDDYLEVIDADGKPFWHGNVSLEYKREFHCGGIDSVGNPYGQQAIRGWWVHGFQENLSPDAWADMFFSEMRAWVSPKNERLVTDMLNHPFRQPIEKMRLKLNALPIESATKLFHSAIYGWLSFYSNGGWSSVGRYLGMNYNQVLRALNSPTDKQINAWKSYPKNSDDTLLPFSYDMLFRLGLLWQIHGHLTMQYGTELARKQSAIIPLASLSGRRPVDLMGGPEDELITLIQILNDECGS